MNQPLNFFKQTIKNKRLSHLYLLSGVKGSGKLLLAQQVAADIVSQTQKTELDLLKNIQEERQPNVFFIRPDGLSIKKEQIIALQKEFSKTSLVKGPRIYIIVDVDKITTSAANSLLKFMEEPESSEVYGILLTSNESTVLPTIISRSQVIKLYTVSEDSLKQTLLENEVSSDMASVIPYVTKNIDEAMQLVEDVFFNTYLDLMKQISTQWMNRQTDIRLLLKNHQNVIIDTKEHFQMFLEMLLLLGLDVLHQKNQQPLIYEHLSKQISVIALNISEKQIERMIHEIKQSIKKQTYYINLELAIEYLAQVIEIR